MVLILIGSVDWLLVWGEVREQSIDVILLWKAKDKEYLTIYKDYERGRTMYHMMLQLWQCRAHVYKPPIYGLRLHIIMFFSQWELY